MAEKFNIRVYGIVISDGKVLVSHEQFRGIRFTKFPGGGLTWGEGIVDCLHREFNEELGWSPPQWDHFYTTEHFQQSAFNEQDQLISIYFTSTVIGREQQVSSPTQHLDLSHNKFEWVDLSDLSVEMFRWPIDQLVVDKINARYSSKR